LTRRAIQCALLIAGLSLGACQQAEVVDDGPPVDVEALRQKHNARAEKIEQFWSRAVVEARWTDADGEKHFEQGDGPLIVRKPTDVALAIGKLGETFLWLGSGAERYWLFELKPPQGQPPTAYVGRFGEPLRTDIALPLPIRPDALIDLLGITTIANNPSLQPVADSSGVTFIVSNPELEDGPRIYIRLDANTALPQHVTLTDSYGMILLHAELDQYEPLKLDGAAPGSWPKLPTRIAVTSEQYDAELTLFLSSLNDGKARGKVKDAQFDFDTLKNALKPEKIQSLNRE